MHKKPEPQLALSLGYSNTPPKLDEVTLAWASAMPSCSTEKSLTRSYAPRNYPHSPEQIAEEIRVDEEGRLWWKKRNGGRRNTTAPISCKTARGYISVNYKGKVYTGHIIAFCLYHGRWPLPGTDIDHINGVKTDNRKGNIREVSRTKNCHNRHTLSKRNSSGHNGIFWCNTRRVWVAAIRVNGKVLRRKFLLKEDAIDCRLAWEEEFNHTTTIGFKANIDEAIRL